jgi:NNP family nitrate/nitrite transporter-like MFS transporter
MQATRMPTAWNPDDPRFWETAGRPVARRNLWLSIPALVLSFAVWMLWSAVVVHLPAVGFRYTTNQLFWLTALPALCGATLRSFYAFGVPMIGGRRFTTLATASLLLPALGIGFAVQNPATPYEWMVVLALLCGLGGGNFASAMAHISYCYPEERTGTVLGLAAGIGHLGIVLVQWVVPLVIGVSLLGALAGAPQDSAQGTVWLQNAGFVWVPLIVLATALAWFGMDDLPQQHAGFSEQAVIVTRRHNWLMSWLYLGTFGSFIGFSAALPMLAQSQFHGDGTMPWLWLGPLIGAVLRPLGGWLADTRGGARTTFWSFVAMACGALVAIAALPHEASNAGASAAAVPGGFMAAFALIFAGAGIGTGSTFRMIPSLFMADRLRGVGALPSARARAAHQGHVEAAASLGFASAIGAYGGFVIPKTLGSAISWTGSPVAALLVFLGFYLSCIALTWWFYSRRQAPYPC